MNALASFALGVVTGAGGVLAIIGFAMMHWHPFR